MLQHGAHEDRKPRSVGSDDVQGDGAGRPLHLKHRRVVGLVVDAAPGGQEVAEGPLADEVGALAADPRKERLVDLEDRAVGGGRQVAARRPLVEPLGIVVQEGGVEGVEGLVAHDRTNAAMASVV